MLGIYSAPISAAYGMGASRQIAIKSPLPHQLLSLSSPPCLTPLAFNHNEDHFRSGPAGPDRCCQRR